jgi:hypothetical protein
MRPIAKLRFLKRATDSAVLIEHGLVWGVVNDDTDSKPCVRGVSEPRLDPSSLCTHSVYLSSADSGAIDGDSPCGGNDELVFLQTCGAKQPDANRFGHKLDKKRSEAKRSR